MDVFIFYIMHKMYLFEEVNPLSLNIVLRHWITPVPCFVLKVGLYVLFKT